MNKINPDGDYRILAQDIGDFERILAQVSKPLKHLANSFKSCFMQYWLTKTELRNASATYNPMTLDELTGIFAIVCARECMYIIIYMYVLVGLDKLF